MPPERTGFVCEICGEEFDSSEGLERHGAEVHDNPRPEDHG
jgi:rubredoxin